MATIKSFEVDRWSEKDEKGRVKHIGMLKMGEVFEMLKEHLSSKDMLPDEYFLISQNDWNEDWELPDYDYAICIPNFVTIHSRFFGTSKKSGWTVIVCPLFWSIDILC